MRKGAWLVLLLCGCMFISSSVKAAQFSPPVRINSPGPEDHTNEMAVTIKAGSGGVWLAAWAADGIKYSRSFDQGRTWSAPAPLMKEISGDTGMDSDPALATDGQGRWIAVWSSTDSLGGTIGTDSDILAAYSEDNGATWSAPVPVNGYAATDTKLNGYTLLSCEDRQPCITTDGQGHWVVGWGSHDNLNDNPYSSFWLSKGWVAVSSDVGRHWSTPYTLQEMSDGGISKLQSPQLCTDGHGRWVACWSSVYYESGGDFDLYYSLSSDNGQSWTKSAPFNNYFTKDSGVDYSPALATDGQGHWMLAWTSNDGLGGTLGSDFDILYSQSLDNGVTWSWPAALNSDAASDGNDDDMGTRLVYDNRGNWIACWSSKKRGGDADCFIAVRGPGANTWTAAGPLNPWALADDAGGIDDEMATLASDAQGRWMAVWASNYDPLAGPATPNPQNDVFMVQCAATPPVTPKIAVAPDSLNFRRGSGYAVDVISHNQPTAQTVVVTNDGMATLQLGNIRFSGSHAADFTLVPQPTLPLSIPPLESRSLAVRFAPGESAITLNMSATLEFSSNDTAKPTATVAISGDAVPTELSRFAVE